MWPRRLLEIRRKLNRSSYVIITLGLLSLAGNAYWVWTDRSAFLAQFQPRVILTWFHPAHVNSLVIAIIILYAMRQISRTRQKLAPLGYPLLEAEEKHRGVEVWRSVEPLTKRPAILHMIHPERSGVGRETWKDVSHCWVRRSEKARRLSSPHIARVLDVGYAQHERFYTVMEMPRGMRLDLLLEQHGAIPLNRTVFLMAQVAHAVQDAHDAGLCGLSLHPRHCWVGFRSSSMDWITIMLSGYSVESDDECTPMKDIRLFGLMMLGMLQGKWIPDTSSMVEVRDVLRSMALPFGIEQVLECCIDPTGESSIPIEELARRLWDGIQCPSWNNDQAAAWWNEQIRQKAAP